MLSDIIKFARRSVPLPSFSRADPTTVIRRIAIPINFDHPDGYSALADARAFCEENCRAPFTWQAIVASGLGVFGFTDENDAFHFTLSHEEASAVHAPSWSVVAARSL